MKAKLRSDLKLEPWSRFVELTQAQAPRLRRQIANVHQAPTPERVHRLRITIRKIRAALWLVEHGSPRLSFRKLQAELRGLGRSLGQVRELDVAIQDAKKYRVKTKRLKKARRVVRRSLVRKSNSHHRKEITTLFAQALGEMRRHGEITLRPAVTSLRKRISPWKKRKLRADVDLHQLRIFTKKVRYSLEAMEHPASPLRDLQAALGRGHDLEVLGNFAAKNRRLGQDAKKQYRTALDMRCSCLEFADRHLRSLAR